MTDKINVSSCTKGRELAYCNVPILKYTCTYPDFTSNDPCVNTYRINDYYKNAAQEFALHVMKTLWPSAVADYKNSLRNDYPIHEYEAVYSFTMTLNENCLLSLYTEQYEYTGGAHGSTVRRGDTWLLPQGKKLSLQELFPPCSAYVLHIETAVIAQIEAQMADGSGAYFDNYRQLVVQTFNPRQFYLTPEGLAVFFQQYDIAPYSSGIPTFILPYEEIGAVLPKCC